LTAQSIQLKELTDEEAMNLTGANDANMRLLSKILGTEISYRNNQLFLKDADEEQINEASEILQKLMPLLEKGKGIAETDILYAARMIHNHEEFEFDDFGNMIVGRTAGGKAIVPKTKGQKAFAKAMDENPVVFAIGPAGTGKTYLAVVKAVSALKKAEVKRIVLTRPAVEAGENLGFLPGDLKEKVDPYLTPLYDALYDTLGVEQTERLIERKVIEIAPLAYMRGRTLNDAYVILDEAQNTTASQMKMFLTRLGFQSHMVITGDVTQIDLDHRTESGLIQAERVLKDVSDIAVLTLTADDVVRHPLVQKIIEAYEKEAERETEKDKKKYR